MDRADFHLAILLAYLFAAGTHAAMAWSIRRRLTPASDRGAERRLFAWANVILALWHLLQFAEYRGAVLGSGIHGASLKLLLGAQLVSGLLVLAIFLHLLATFERRFRRRPSSLRAALTGHLHRRAGVYVPAAYLLVGAGAILYLIDASAAGAGLGALRDAIGPTSAYLFGLVLLLIVFVMFPARPGQEHLVVPVVGRGLLLASLGLTLGLVALWFEIHPRRTTEALLPWLHLNSVPFVVFLALVRYEFSFMDGFVRNGLRVIAWGAVVGFAYWSYHRVPAWGTAGSHYSTSLARVAIFVAAVAVAPWIGSRVANWSDRVLFGRRVDLERAVRRFSERLAGSPDLTSLLEGASSDVATAVQAHTVRVKVGQAEAEDVGSDIRLRIPLGSSKSPPGWLLLGERRNLYPYFDGEKGYLRVVASLLGAAVTTMRRQPVAPPPPVAPPAASAPSLASPERPVFPPQRLGREWVAEVLESAHLGAERDPELARQVLDLLHRLTAHLESAAGPWTRLGSELAFARDWIALERLRRRHALEASIHAPETLYDQEMPRGAVLPLLRNALEHGLAGLLRDGRLEVQARETGDGVRLEVLDNGPGLPETLDFEALGPDGGLARLRACLAEFDRDRARLVRGSEDCDGTCVGVEVPRRRRA